MITALPYDEGLRNGGSCLYRESQEHFDGRRSLALVGLGTCTLAVIILLILSALVRTALVFVLSLLGASLFAIFIVVSYRSYRSMTPVTVCSGGFSLGEGKRPFRPFSGVSDIRERTSSGLKGGRYLYISFRDGTHDFLFPSLVPDYQKVGMTLMDSWSAVKKDQE